MEEVTLAFGNPLHMYAGSHSNILRTVHSQLPKVFSDLHRLRDSDHSLSDCRMVGCLYRIAA